MAKKPAPVAALDEITSEGIADGSIVHQGERYYWYDRVVNMMDDGLFMSIQIELEPETNQEFFDAYCRAHECKYGTEFLHDGYDWEELHGNRQA